MIKNLTSGKINLNLVLLEDGEAPGKFVFRAIKFKKNFTREKFFEKILRREKKDSLCLNANTRLADLYINLFL